MLCPICKINKVSGRNRICDSPICREEMRKSWHYTKIIIPEGYLSVTAYAKLKGISVQAVTKKCRSGKLNAFQDPKSGRWYIPVSDEAKKSMIKTAPRRKNRPFKATDEEWQQIVERAALTKYSVNEYMLRKILYEKI